MASSDAQQKSFQQARIRYWKRPLRSPRTPALLLDFDGVLRQWPADDDTLERPAGLPAGTIRQIAFAPELLGRAISGEINDAQWRQEVAMVLARSYPQVDTQGVVVQWASALGWIDQEILEIARAWRAHGSLVALLSNGTSRLDADVAALGLADDFDLVVNSSQLGIAKPDPRFFRHALQALRIEADQALYVDDSADNVRVAAQLGIRARQFTTADAMRAWLANQQP